MEKYYGTHFRIVEGLPTLKEQRHRLIEHKAIVESPQEAHKDSSTF
jgi:hypothetical protein